MKAGSADERVQCCVPFCKHTTAAVRSGVRICDFICSTHWALTNHTLRRRYNNSRKIRGGHAALVSIWAELKKQAIERGAGI